MATNEEVFMTIRNNRAEISLALGEAVLDIVQKGHEVSRENLAQAMKNKAEKERDDERLLNYWKACNMLV
ncbi:6,7-dimethyl-8-ribityllumazine synthase subunit [Enterobacter hormaechei ATCC 49162]|nr:6,7-dimethyl-8-ribityllumazine synthase subunit [Enterobacter hormaechei ATCC 49162]